MRSLSLFCAVAALCLDQVSAVSWNYLMWLTPSTDAQFIEFSMDMVIPTLPKAGTYYLWPGLQDVGTSGVYQEVLDGRSGTWWIGSGWCCSNPSLPWGGGFNVAGGASVSIDMKRTDDTNWTSTMTEGTQEVPNDFALAYKNFNQALLAIELYDVTWDFGALEWNNIVMVMNTTETAWCTNPPVNYDSNTKYTMSTPVVATSAGVTTCTIANLVMEGPA